MTTVSSTGGSTAYTAPATASSATNTSSTATATPYDGTAAVAQAQALAAQQLANGSSGSTGSLLGLSSDIVSLLQGGAGTGLISTLLGGDGSNGNGLVNAQTQLALYGAAQKRSDAAASVDRVSEIIAQQNATLNAATAAALAPQTASTPSTTNTSLAETSATDTSA